MPSRAGMSDAQDPLSLVEQALAHGFGLSHVVEEGQGIEDPAKRLAFYEKAYVIASEVQKSKVFEKEQPVDPATFLDDPYFTDANTSMWPALREEIIRACSGEYIEAVFTGAIGTGKTTAALHVLRYYLYRLMNIRDPHAAYGLDPASEIAFVMQSVTGGTAYTVDYMRFRRMLENSPWFTEHAPFERDRKATIQFKNSSVFVQPLPGNAEAAIGENVFGGLIDEVNHMRVIQGSTKKRDGEVYDQMLENYRAIARRRESRFQRTGRVPGMLCLIGSANYAGQFTDRKKEERDRQLERDGKTSIYIFDKRPWEIQPSDRFSTERFQVFLGDGTRKPRVIPASEAISEADKPFIMEVPEDYRNTFESDLPGAVKDVAGIALHGFSNFIANYAAIKKSFGSRKNIFNPDWCDFDRQGARIIKHEIPNPKAKRYIHVDLALSMDYAALSMAHCPGFTVIDRGGGMKDTVPRIVFDGCLTIRPAGGSQIPIYKIKKLVFVLQEMGYPIRWVSLDGFQSADFIQTMRRARFISGILSLDRKPDPYLLTRQLIVDGAVEGPASELACKELRDLVWVSQNTKVDHPVEGSKDLADTIAGCCYGIASKREIWVSHGVDPTKSSLVVKTKEDRDDAAA